MSWGISIHLLWFSLWNIKTWSPWWFYLIFLQSLLFVHCVANSLMLFLARYVFTKILKNSVLLSVPDCITFKNLINWIEICSNTYLIAIPSLDLSGSNHAYLDKISIIILINLNLLLIFESYSNAPNQSLIVHLFDVSRLASRWNWHVSVDVRYMLTINLTTLLHLLLIYLIHVSLLPGTDWIFQHKQLGFWDHCIASSVAPPCSFSCGFPSNQEFSTIIWELQHDSKHCILFKNFSHLILLHLHGTDYLFVSLGRL